jgi:hypothetical protein
VYLESRIAELQDEKARHKEEKRQRKKEKKEKRQKDDSSEATPAVTDIDTMDVDSESVYKSAMNILFERLNNIQQSLQHQRRKTRSENAVKKKKSRQVPVGIWFDEMADLTNISYLRH